MLTQILPLDTSLEVHFPPSLPFWLQDGYEKLVKGKEEAKVKTGGAQPLH